MSRKEGIASVSFEKADIMARETGYIIRIGQHTELAQIEADAWSKEPFAHRDRKFTLQRIANKLESAKKELFALIPKESEEHMKQHVIDADTATQLQSVQAMLMDMPKLKRDECEKYIVGVYNTYQLNKRPK